MTTVKQHERSKPYSRLKQKMSARLRFSLMLKQMEKNLDRALERDALKGWPEEDRKRIEETW